MHDLRQSFASHLIRQGLDPVLAARQLGHARPSITLDIYEHDFKAARSATTSASASPLFERFRKRLENGGGAYRDRTGDLRLAKPALSQLS